MSYYATEFKYRLQDSADYCFHCVTSEEAKFYLILIAFFSLVLILPMTPMILFVFTEQKPSINPEVFDYLYNAAARYESEQ